MSEQNVMSPVSVPHNPSSTRRWWWWKAALPVGLLLAVIAVSAVYLLFVPQYEASSLLEMHPQQFIAFDLGGIGTSSFQTQMESIRSRWILGMAAANEKVKQLPELSKEPDPIDWLQKHVSVAQVNGSELFAITYSSPNPENAALVANEITRQYLTAQEETEAKSTRKIVTVLAREMEAREKNVRGLRTQVQAAAQVVAGEDPDFGRPDPSAPYRNPLGELQSRVIDTEIDEAMQMARIAVGEEELQTAEECVKAHAAQKAAQNAATTEAPASSTGNQLTVPPKGTFTFDNSINNNTAQIVGGALGYSASNFGATFQSGAVSMASGPLAVYSLKSNDNTNLNIAGPPTLQNGTGGNTIGGLITVGSSTASRIAGPLTVDYGLWCGAANAVNNLPNQTPLSPWLNIYTRQNGATTNAAAARPKRELTAEERALCDEMVRRAIAENANVKQIESILFSKTIQLLQVETTSEFGQLDPSYSKLQKEIAMYEKSLENLKQKLVAPAQEQAERALQAQRRARVNSEDLALAKRKQELEEMRSTLRCNEITEKKLRSAYADKLKQYLQEVEQYRDENLNLIFKKDELARAQGVLKKITDRVVALQTERAAPWRVDWRLPAVTPVAPVEAVPYQNMTLAGLVGLCLPYAAGLFGLVLWNLGKLIRKLEPVEVDTVVRREDCKPEDPAQTVSEKVAI